MNDEKTLSTPMTCSSACFKLMIRKNTQGPIHMDTHGYTWMFQDSIIDFGCVQTLVFWVSLVNLVPRLSSLRSSLEKETLVVNAGHMAPTYSDIYYYRWEDSYAIWVNVTPVTLVINCKRLELRTLTSTTHLPPQESY